VGKEGGGKETTHPPLKKKGGARNQLRPGHCTAGLLDELEKVLDMWGVVEKATLMGEGTRGVRILFFKTSKGFGWTKESVGHLGQKWVGGGLLSKVGMSCFV